MKEDEDGEKPVDEVDAEESNATVSPLPWS